MVQLEPRASLRLLRPFVAVLRRQGRVPERVYEAVEHRDLHARIPLAIALKLLRAAVLLSGDRYLGLRAAREVPPGDYELLEYMAISAPTVRQGLEVVGDYIQLLNDAGRARLYVEGRMARFAFECDIPLPPAAVDFELAVAYEAMGRWQRGPVVLDACVHFCHGPPQDLRQYIRTFGSAELVFHSSFDGFKLPASVLELPQPGADPRLHALLRRCADRELAVIRGQASLSQRVQELQAEQLQDGRVCADTVAARLQMSRRTLTRRLERDGSTFRGLLDGLRKQLAARYLVDEQLSATAVAARLGFADVAAFHRAFKRWYGETPSGFRKARLPTDPERASRAIDVRFPEASERTT